MSDTEIRYVERNRRLRTDYENGITYRDLAEKYNISFQRAHQIVQFNNNVKASSLRRVALHVLGDKCSECGFSDWRALQIDHIAGGGNKHHATVGQYAVYKDVLNNSHKYQCLCANCNWIKRYENKEATQPQIV